MIKICEKCSSSFNHLIQIDGKIRNLQRRRFCLNCSPFKCGNNKDLTKIKMNNLKKCSLCKLHLPDECFYLCNGKNGRKFRHSNCIECQKKRNKNITDTTKQQCVEYKGGCCQKCGYKHYLGALEFHHLNPNEKDFAISHKHMWNFEKLKPELDKCILLCKNCHAEEHGNM